MRRKRIVYVTSEVPVGMFFDDTGLTGRCTVGSSMRYIDHALGMAHTYFDVSNPAIHNVHSRFRFSFRCSRERFLEVCGLMEKDHVTVENVTSLRRLMR